MARTTHIQGQLYVGTSGWSYAWEGFYPAGLPSRDFLVHYSQHFRTVEINYSFYHLPRPSTYEKWAAQTPRDFVFAVKLSRFITHVRRLSGVNAELQKFLTNVSALGPKLGPILVQLPPSLKRDTVLLNDFLTIVNNIQVATGVERYTRLAIEFRHGSWFDNPDRCNVLKTLESHRAAFVLAHSSRYPYPEPEPVTSDFVYLRFHGPGRMFASLYGKERLQRWTPRVQQWVEQGFDVYAYFNNDMQAYAVADAKEFLQLVACLERTRF